MSNIASHDQRVEEALAEYLRRVDEGEPADQVGFLKSHPDVADEPRSYFAMSEVIHQMAGPTVGESTGEQVPRVVDGAGPRFETTLSNLLATGFATEQRRFQST